MPLSCLYINYTIEKQWYLSAQHVCEGYLRLWLPGNLTVKARVQQDTGGMDRLI